MSDPLASPRRRRLDPPVYRVTDELRSIREDVAGRAAGQGGVFRREHLLEWGHDARVLPTMVRRGWWRRLQYGVYVDQLVRDAAMAEPHDLHLLMAAAALHGMLMPAYAFGVTAALVHDLPLPHDAPHHIDLIREPNAETRARSQRTPRDDGLQAVRIRCHELGPEQVTRVNGLPAVHRQLAAVSAAAMLKLDWAVAILDAVAWERPEAIVAMHDVADHWPLLRGIGTVRAALPLVRPGAQTPLESHSRLRLVRSGLAEPELQVPLYDRAGLIGLVDMYWPDLGVVGEADGALKYEGREDLLREKAREDRLRALGLAVVRWTWAEIWQRPDEIARRVLASATYSRRFVGQPAEMRKSTRYGR